MENNSESTGVDRIVETEDAQNVHRNTIANNTDTLSAILNSTNLFDPSLRRGTLDNIKRLLRTGVDVNTSGFENGLAALHLAAKKNDATLADYLLSRGADVNTRHFGPICKTPLQVAAYHNSNKSHRELIGKLLHSGADVNAQDENGKTALHYLVDTAGVKTVRVLLNFGADVNVRNGKGNAPLINAITSGNTEVARLLLQHGTDVNSVNVNGSSALHIAACKNHGESHGRIIEVLLESRPEVNQRDNSGKTALHYLVDNAGVKTVRVLLNFGADVNARDERGETPVFVAAFHKNYAVLQLLVDRGSDLKVKNSDGLTPLLASVRWKNYDDYFGVIKALLKSGANVNARDRKNETALHWYVKEGIFWGVELLMRFGPDVDAENYRGDTPLFDIVYRIDADDYFRIAKLLVSSGSDVNKLTAEGSTPLLQASWRSKGKCRVVELLLKSGADVNARDSTGNAPIHYSMYHNGDKTNHLLLKFGADVNVSNNSGVTPLLEAICGWNMKKYLECLGQISHPIDDLGPPLTTYEKKKYQKSYLIFLKRLLKKGADVNARDESGKTPLHYLVRNPIKVKVVELLLSYQADVYARDSEGEPPLFEALRGNNYAVVKLLIDYGSEVNILSKYGSTPLHMACEYGYSGIVRQLVSKGADVDARDPLGKSALHYLVRKADVETVEWFLSFGPAIDVKDARAETPMITAILRGNAKIVRLLLDHGSDVNSVNAFGSTPLHVACCYTEVKVVKCLLEKGASWDALDSEGRTPMMCGMRVSNLDKTLLKFLMEYAFENVVDVGSEFVLNANFSEASRKIVLEHLAKLKSLNVLNTNFVEDILNRTECKDYFERCTKELEVAKKTKLQNSWINFFNLLVDSRKKLKNYAGNAELVESFEKSDSSKKFPIYGASMQKNVKKGIERRALWNQSAVLLSDCLPIYDPHHLIVRNVLDCVMSMKDLTKFCKNDQKKKSRFAVCNFLEINNLE